MVGHHLLCPGLDLDAVGDVDAGSGDFHVLDLRGGLGKADLIDIAQRQVATPTRQLQRQTAADA